MFYFWCLIFFVGQWFFNHCPCSCSPAVKSFVLAFKLTFLAFQINLSAFKFTFFGAHIIFFFWGSQFACFEEVRHFHHVLHVHHRAHVGNQHHVCRRTNKMRPTDRLWDRTQLYSFSLNYKWTDPKSAAFLNVFT